MPTALLRANQHLVVPFDVRGDDVALGFYVEAHRAVHAYVVDNDNLWSFRRGEGFASYGSSRKQRVHNFDLRLTRGPWSLLIVNYSDDDIAIYFEID
jgi:hypothetical protein